MESESQGDKNEVTPATTCDPPILIAPAMNFTRINDFYLPPLDSAGESAQTIEAEKDGQLSTGRTNIQTTGNQTFYPRFVTDHPGYFTDYGTYVPPNFPVIVGQG